MARDGELVAFETFGAATNATRYCIFSCTKPKLFVHGTLDEFGPIAQMNSWYADLPEPKRMVRVEGADHFFTGHLDKLVAAIVDYFKEQ